MNNPVNNQNEQGVTPESQSHDGAFGWVDDAPYYQAGLAGYSDAAMRLVARKHGCPFCITEAMLDHFLIQGGKGLKAAELDDDDHPIAGQLMGSHPEDIGKGAKILMGLDYDVVDINLACPVKKIKKKCRGGHLLSVPEEAIAILESVADAVGGKVPMTIKLRRGFDDEGQSAENLYQIIDRAIELGFHGVTVHGRTVTQKYIGPSNWAFLKSLTERYAGAMEKGFHVFGSGDIFSPQAIFEMLEQTGVQAVSVARGCIGNPWIFEQARAIMQGGEPMPPTIAQQRDVLQEHFVQSMKIHGEQQAGRLMRKFGIKFSVHHPQADAVKSGFIAVKDLKMWQDVLDEFYGDDAQESDGRGIVDMTEAHERASLNNWIQS